MGRMNTRLIVSAEDRGAARLLNRLGAESDATVKSFSKLGQAFTGLIGGFTLGYGVKQALSWVDDYRMDVMSIATTLSDTWKDTGKTMAEVFGQNKVHAEEFFKLLRRQARQSISSFEELRSAYAIFASKGMALDVVEDQAKMFATLVDRITLATKGQNRAVQVQQELRAILEGRARPSDVLAKIFVDRDAAFIQNMKKLVAERNVTGIMNYMSELMSDVPLDKELGNLLSKQLANVQDDVRFWAKDAFAPLYEVMIDIVADASTAISGGDSPLLKGIEGLIDDISAVAKKSKEIFAGFGGSEMGRFLMEAAPRFIATSAAVLLTAKAFTALVVAMKAAALASTAGLGAVAVAAGAVAVGGGWAAQQKTREQAEVFDDKWEYTKALIADGIQGFLSVAKGATVAIVELVRHQVTHIFDVFKGIPDLLAKLWEGVKAVVFKAAEGFLAGLQIALNKTTDVFLSIYYEVRKAMQYIMRPLPYQKKARDVAIAQINEEQRLAKGDYHPWFSEQITALAGKTAEAEKKSGGIVEDIADEVGKNLVKNVQGTFDAFMAGVDVTVNDHFQRQSARAALADTMAVDTVDSSAMTGKPSVNIALLDAAIAASAKSLEGLAKSGANLDSVIAQMESAAMRGGDEFAYALSQVNREYANYKAKIVRFGGAQEDSLAALSVEQAEVERLLATAVGVDKEILDAKHWALELGKMNAMHDDRILSEKKLQAELERQMTESTAEEANALQERIIASKQSEKRLMEESEGMMKELNAAKRDVALLGLERYREESRAMRTVAEADRLEGKYMSLRSLQAGLPGKSSSATYAAQAAMDALNLQKQMAEIARTHDIAGAKESEAAAQERINKLQAQYIELYRATAVEAEEQVERLEKMSALAESGTMADGFIAALEEMRLATKDTFEHIRELTHDIFSSMESTMSSVFFDGFSGELNKAKDYFSAFGRSIVASFSDMLAQMAMEQLRKAMTMKIIGGVFSLFGGGGAMAGAMGGVAEGGFQAFASGGIVSRPTLGLIGEGRYNEAVVPLPDGRSIPVAMRGNAGVTVNVIDNSGSTGVEKTVNKEMDEQGNMVIDIILDALSRNKRGAKSQFKSILGVN